MSLTISNDLIEHAAASPIVLALIECDDELRAEALTLLKQLARGDLDKEGRNATIALIAELLFPNADHNGAPGLDLEEAETIARATCAETNPILDWMDREEAAFADCLRQAMTARNITQEQLAEKIGVGQSAISMMLNRKCRPQKRTVARLAEALEISPDKLWPIANGEQ